MLRKYKYCSKINHIKFILTPPRMYNMYPYSIFVQYSYSIIADFIYRTCCYCIVSGFLIVWQLPNCSKSTFDVRPWSARIAGLSSNAVRNRHLIKVVFVPPCVILSYWFMGFQWIPHSSHDSMHVQVSLNLLLHRATEEYSARYLINGPFLPQPLQFSVHGIGSDDCQYNHMCCP